jgi:hypothetical protein
MKITPNPRIAIHTAKLDLSRKVLSPISYKYLSIFNDKRARRRHKNTPKLTTIKDLIKSLRKNELTADDLLKHFSNIPRRNISKATKIIPHLHLSFRLLWTQLALLLSSSQEKKPLYQVVANVPDKLLSRASEAAINKKRKTTIIRELLRIVVRKLPVDIELWAVFEMGSEQGGAHIHIIAALDETNRQKLKAALSNFESVKFKSHADIDGRKILIDIGAAHYFSKETNNNSNLFVTPALKSKAKAVEREYRGFIADNKPFLLNERKAIQRSIEAHEQRRLHAVPKTYEEWEEQSLNQATNQLDSTVYWEEIEGEPREKDDNL